MKNNSNITTVLSLFDGISCARVALDRLGYREILYLASEVDKYAIQIAQKNYPDTIQLGDVCKIQRDMLPQHIDLLIGGSPCQDLSIAKNNRKGLDGERSGLFWEWVRLWKECQPKYWVLENVNSMPKEAKRIISETLGVEPIMINAALVSAQSRKRLFWTNICADAMGNQTMPQPEDRGILLKDILESGCEPKGKDKSLMIRARYGNDFSSVKTAISRYEKGFTQIVSDAPIRVGCVGGNYQGNRVYFPDGKSIALSAQSGGLGSKTGLYAITEPVAIDHYNGHRIVPDNKAKTLGTNPQCETAVAGQSIMQNYTIRKLTPVECERLMTLPDKYTEGISNTQRYKCLGNGFVVEVVKHILSYMEGLER